MESRRQRGENPRNSGQIVVIFLEIPLKFYSILCPIRAACGSAPIYSDALYDDRSLVDGRDVPERRDGCR